MKPLFILKIAAGVVVLWVVALTAIHGLHLLQPTSTSIGLWAQRQHLDSLSAQDRAGRVDALADKMNQLSFAERQKLFQNPGFQSFTQQMTNDEKLSLMDKTLSKGMAQLMDVFNRMKPEERRRIVAQALANMKQRDEDGQGPRPGLNNPAMQKVIQTGFTSYLENASAQTKLDLAPLVEQMEVDMQGLAR